MSGKVVELYIDSVKGITQGRNPYSASKNPHSVRRRFGSLEDNVKVTTRSFTGWSESETALRNMLVTVSSEFEAEFKVYDITRTGYMLRAYFKGVRRVPTVVIGKRKFSGQVSERKIREHLSRRNKR